MAKLQTTSSAIARARAAGDPAAEAEARRDHAAARIEVAIDRALASAPELTSEQVENLAALLRKHRPAALQRKQDRAEITTSQQARRARRGGQS